MTRKLPELPRIAIAGATGTVGRELLQVLEKRALPMASMKLLASERSVGKRMRFRDEDLELQLLSEEAFSDVDLAFFSCGAETSRRFARACAARGVVVVDNSSAFRMDKDVPLIVPEVNAAALGDLRAGPVNRIIANPNCSTIILVLALAPLAKAFGLLRVVVSTYQAASGAGEKGMHALLEDSRRFLASDNRSSDRSSESSNSRDPEASLAVFGHPLAFNLVPQIDVFVAGALTREEWKMQQESRKILGLSSLALDVTCVRVPVLRCHSESVSVETKRPVDLNEARALLGAAAGLELVDDPEKRQYPMPSLASGRDPVLVGRIRRSEVFQNGLNFWLSGDQLLKGAALNAVQIVESLLEPGPALPD